jgi:hypothetical protein
MEIEKEVLSKKFAELIGAFYAEERGNRVTSNNLEGLMAKVNTLLDGLEAEKEKEN